VAAGVFGILAAAVGAINTFFRKGENAGLHRATAAVAAELGRSIEWAIEHPVDAASEEARFNRFSDAITRIDQSPRVPDDIWDKVKNRSGSP
jgi:hypothetical protein